ncbi:glutathione synthase [Buchnera aphidicola]|uniref:glutathione synthase n=1 Tax=Buchnera aphidicola TaxID=9 RepID=UPI0031B84967
MKLKIGIVMDSLKKINIKKDSSIAILNEAQKRKHKIYYINIDNLFIKNNKSYAEIQKIKLNIKKKKWFILKKKKDIILTKLHVILMRKDPPFNMNYIYSTYILEIAEKKGVLIINKPKNLRNYNEKIFSLHFKKIITDTLVTKKYSKIKKFFNIHKDIIIKPLNGMGGRSIFRIKKNDNNYSVIIENMTKYETVYCMIQRYLPEIKMGDKRIIIINGKIIPWCLSRIPKKGEHRGNLAVGGEGKIEKINKNDLKISKYIAPKLKKLGLLIVGIDIIGNKLTEINITSPTGICEIQKYTKISITKIIIKMIEKKIKKKKYDNISI